MEFVTSFEPRNIGGWLLEEEKKKVEERTLLNVKYNSYDCIETFQSEFLLVYSKQANSVVLLAKCYQTMKNALQLLTVSINRRG